jgi:hypothetical protein
MGDRSSRRMRRAAGIFAYFILHETSPLVLVAASLRSDIAPAASGRPERSVQGA